MTINLMHGDCLELMKSIPDGSVDMVLTDPPYGTTACKWDSVIPFEPMWEQLKRVTKRNGAIVLTASQPFTSALVMSNVGMFKYDWTWQKNRPTGSQHARNRPMSKHESIVVFSKAPMGHISLLAEGRMEYNPQGIRPTGKKKTVKSKGFHGNHIGSRPLQVGIEYDVFTGFPDTVLKFDKDESHFHPTQKPVALMEYLIKTYTNEGETVLDFTMGSGTTGVAAKNLNRSFIGIELDEGYFEIAKGRILA
jgi:site-specific DNA-methyltransferase (adenine-specific)